MFFFLKYEQSTVVIFCLQRLLTVAKLLNFVEWFVLIKSHRFLASLNKIREFAHEVVVDRFWFWLWSKLVIWMPVSWIWENLFTGATNRWFLNYLLLLQIDTYLTSCWVSTQHLYFSYKSFSQCFFRFLILAKGSTQP